MASVKRGLSQAWKKWLKVAAFLGNVQLWILLTLLYVLAIPFMAVPMKLLSDPLALRRPKGWIARSSESSSPARLIDQ